MRVTHDFSSAHRLQIGYSYEADSSANSGVGTLVLPEAGANGNSREDHLIFNDRVILSPTLVNQLLITLEKNEDVTNSVTNARAIQVNGFFTGGGAQADSSRTENTIQMNEVVSWSHGRHYIRFGVQLPQFSRRAVDDHTNRLGTLSYASLADYPVNPATDLGTPQSFTAQQGIGRGIDWANEVGTFAQDQIKLSPKLQLTIGIRYDWVTYLTDNNNVSPRLSFNVLNHTNFSGYIGSLNSIDPITNVSRFMQPTGASPGRQFQFTLGYRFLSATPTTPIIRPANPLSPRCEKYFNPPPLTRAHAEHSPTTVIRFGFRPASSNCRRFASHRSR
jgi:outer membrane receptor protein involved in Fe transport